MVNLTAIFAAALMFLWAAGFSSVVEIPGVALASTQEQNSSGTLMPGGSWTSRDGVVISDPENQLRSPANVFVEPLNPASVAEPIDEDWTPVTFFRVGATPYVGALSGFFRLTFPLPQSESESELKKYAVFGLLRDDEASSDEGRDVMGWMYFSVDEDLINHQIGGFDSVLTDTVFVIAKSKKSLTPSLIGQNSPRSQEVLIQNSSTSGTLMPGGSWTSKDGVRIVAPVGSISSPIQVFVEKVEPVSITVPTPENISIVGDFFRVGASERTDVDEYFEIKLPIPKGELSKNLLVMILITAGSLTDLDLPDDQLIWYFTTLDGFEKDKAIVKDSLLLKEGTVYVLIRYSNVFSNNSTSSSHKPSFAY